MTHKPTDHVSGSFYQKSLQLNKQTAPCMQQPVHVMHGDPLSLPMVIELKKKSIKAPEIIWRVSLFTKKSQRPMEERLQNLEMSNLSVHNDQHISASGIRCPSRPERVNRAAGQHCTAPNRRYTHVQHVASTCQPRVSAPLPHACRLAPPQGSFQQPLPCLCLSAICAVPRHP